MNINDFFGEVKIIEDKLLDFIGNEVNEEENFENLFQIIKSQAIQASKGDLRLFLTLLIKISCNYYRNSNFFSKIEQIIIKLKNDIKKYYSNWEIFKIFKPNKRILLFVIEERIMIIDQEIYEELMQPRYLSARYIEYFTPEIKPFLEAELNQNFNKKKLYNIQKMYKRIQKVLTEQSIENFNAKRKSGENDGYLCKIIQNDSIEEFIIYVDKESYPLNSRVEKSLFETNSILLRRKEPTLIEYAVFFGSVQIFKYLYMNGVKLNSMLWLYAIHGYSDEIIHILEENHIDLNSDEGYISYQVCLKECIKCHHNSIFEYIQNNFSDNKIDKNDLISYCFHYYNFLNLPSEVNMNDVFFYACKYDYYKIVHHYLLKVLKIDLNSNIVFTSLLLIKLK